MTLPTFTPTSTSTPVLDALRGAGVLGPAELHVTDTVARLTGERDPDVLLAIALAVRAPSQGHVCLELARVHDVGLAAEGDSAVQVELPRPDRWLAAIAASPAVRLATDPADRPLPLVLDGGRLYLDRYWRYEQRLVDGLRRLLASERSDRDAVVVDRHLDALFEPPTGAGPDLQRQAARLATERTLTVLTGGPGTGKTTTVVRMLALLWLTAPAGSRPRIVLAAPTGKAAARMAEAIRDALLELELPNDAAAALRQLPAGTLHRLLGWRPDRPTRFRHDATNRLPYDVVVVDEASMASLPLVTKLVDALEDDARLILVGDRDQLTSVDAGAVLSDICGPRRTGARAVPEPQATPTGPTATLAASIVHLTRFHRFGPESGIGAVARAIQRVEDDVSEVLELLRGARTELAEIDCYDDIVLLEPSDRPGEPLPVECRDEVIAGYREGIELALDGAPPDLVLRAYERTRVLTALRRGPHGVEALNRAIEGWLVDAVPGYGIGTQPPVGRPLLVTANDYSLGLFNGDVGVVVHDPDDTDRRRVAFPTADGGVRLLSPSRLPSVETVYAMSVHKSQGSQFHRVVLILPTLDSPLLSRELVYTGLTRARSHATVVASEQVLSRALRRPVQRASGLVERLWGRS